MSVCELFGIIGALCPGVHQLGIVDDFVVSDLGQVSGPLKVIGDSFLISFLSQKPGQNRFY